MKVSVYKLEKGELAVLVQASPGKGRAPVMLADVTRGNLRARVEPLVVAMRMARPPRQPRLP